ncbi:AraC family transcriptional regulator [Bacillus sp. CECT 9360]|uniref:AraC family transcriptional regulator n=1 Tax=Bacillus sp. CECT 9360 TaxID=2845821 RepID=UPI001E62790E|nr:AraC family transcriptional regulator [Bacillus sp. CECT 9360]CAH0344159.1 HTH-type transcriptional activator RhaR [Bacillus sp. CECT 9360]
MVWLESLQRAIDYMEEHLLDQEITIENISKQANVSAFHFQRTFAILTDISVGEYLRRRRLTLAAQELSRTNCKIIDLAYKYGYDTPEAFSKAFRRQHGVSPSEARKYIGKLKSYNRLIIQVSLKGAEPMKYKIVEKGRFQVVGIKREFSLANEENLKGIPKLWEEVNQNGMDDLLFSLNNGQIKGVLGVCVVNSETQSQQAMDYWVATEYDGDIPEGLMKCEIPASKWAVFEVHGPMPHAMQNVWKQIISEWLPSSNYEHAGTPDLEVYTEAHPASPDLYSEIWIPVK